MLTSPPTVADAHHTSPVRDGVTERVGDGSARYRLENRVGRISGRDEEVPLVIPWKQKAD